MGQVFAAREKFEFSNGAIGWRPGGPMDCIGPFAKVQNCPIKGYPGLARYTCYASGYADTPFSVPACTRIRGKYISGFFMFDNDGGVQFVPYDRFAGFLIGIIVDDARYSVDLEWCGEREQRLIVRFCGDWIKDVDSAEEALTLIANHKAGIVKND